MSHIFLNMSIIIVLMLKRSDAFSCRAELLSQ